VLVCAIALFVVAGVIVTIGSGGSGTSASTTAAAPSSTSPAAIAPTGLSATKLGSFVTSTLKQPVYWAGARRGDLYELQRTANGSVFIRYLPRGVRVGDPRSAFLLVATYPYPDALARLQNGATGGTTLPGGGFALVDAARPTNVHLAFPGIPYEIEIYDPSPATAKQIALSGDIRPVG
jgi:hypothetical protein